MNEHVSVASWRTSMFFMSESAVTFPGVERDKVVFLRTTLSLLFAFFYTNTLVGWWFPLPLCKWQNATYYTIIYMLPIDCRFHARMF